MLGKSNSQPPILIMKLSYLCCGTLKIQMKPFRKEWTRLSNRQSETLLLLTLGHMHSTIGGYRCQLHLSSPPSWLIRLTRLGTIWPYRTSGNNIHSQLQYQVLTTARDSSLGSRHPAREWTISPTLGTTWDSYQIIVTLSFPASKVSEEMQSSLRLSTTFWRHTRATFTLN